jgi:hypothetical protein
MTSAELIKSVGPALFGRNWQSELADWLGMNRRTIRRWMSGEDEPRPVVWAELLDITQERHAQLAELIEAIARAGKGLDMSAERVSFKRDGDRYLVYLAKERVGFVVNRGRLWHWTEGRMVQSGHRRTRDEAARACLKAYREQAER